MRLMSWCLFLFFGLTILQAEGGRDFAGRYAISNVVDNGDNTENATLTVRLFNYSGHDIAGARLLLLAGPPGPVETEISAHLTLSNHTDQKVQADVSVPAPELDRWQHGASPRLAMEFTGDDGQLIRRPVELVRDPILAEAQ